MTSNKDIFITLISNESLSYFPQNRPSQFTNVLARQINLDNEEYEVGLLSANISLKKSVEQQLTFNDNDKVRLKIPEVSRDTIEIKGLSATPFPVAELITKLKNKTEVLNAVEFSVSYDAAETAYASVRVNIVGDGILKIDPLLANLLGFTSKRFLNGQHKATLPVNIPLLQKTNSSVQLEYLKYIDKSAKLEQPEDNSLDGLAEALHDAFSKAGETIFVTVNDKEDEINFSAQNKDVEFLIPDKLSKFFGSHLGAYYRGEVSLNIQTIQTRKQEELREHILCCVDLIDEQAYGGKEYPILRAIDIPSGSINTRLQTSFGTVMYYPLKRAHFESISVSLEILSSSSILGSEPASIVIHIRRKQ